MELAGNWQGTDMELAGNSHDMEIGGNLRGLARTRRELVGNAQGTRRDFAGKWQETPRELAGNS